MDVIEDPTDPNEQEENLESLPNNVVEKDSKEWSSKQLEYEESCWEAGLSAINHARKTGEFIEERLSRLGLGSHGDEAAKKSTSGMAMGDFKAGEDDSRIVSRSILEECVQMVVEERCLVKKDGFKGIFDADDEVHEGSNESLKEGAKSGKSTRSSWELLRPSSTPRLAAWLLKAGASEAQVLALLAPNASEASWGLSIFVQGF